MRNKAKSQKSTNRVVKAVMMRVHTECLFGLLWASFSWLHMKCTEFTIFKMYEYIKSLSCLRALTKTQIYIYLVEHSCISEILHHYPVGNGLVTSCKVHILHEKSIKQNMFKLLKTVYCDGLIIFSSSSNFPTGYLLVTWLTGGIRVLKFLQLLHSGFTATKIA